MVGDRFIVQFFEKRYIGRWERALWMQHRFRYRLKSDGFLRSPMWLHRGWTLKKCSGTSFFNQCAPVSPKHVPLFGVLHVHIYRKYVQFWQNLIFCTCTISALNNCTCTKNVQDVKYFRWFFVHVQLLWYKNGTCTIFECTIFEIRCTFLETTKMGGVQGFRCSYKGGGPQNVPSKGHFWGYGSALVKEGPFRTLFRFRGSLGAGHH